MSDQYKLFGDIFVPTSPLTHSYFHATSPHSLCGLKVSQLLDQACEGSPHFEAFTLCDSGERLNFQQIRDKAIQYSKGLLMLGLRKGDVLCISGVTNSDWLHLFFAAHYIGLIILVGPTKYTKPYAKSFEGLIEMTGCKAVVVGPEDDGKIFQAVQETLWKDKGHLDESLPVKHVLCQSGDFGRHSEVQKRGIQAISTLNGLGDKLIDDKFAEACTQVVQEDSSFMFPTSGSTGLPKLVCVTQRSVVNVGKFMLLHRNDKDPTTRVAFVGHQCDGFFCLLFVCHVVFHHGKVSGVILPSSTHNYPENTLKALEKERCTYLATFPYLLIDILNCPNREKYDLSSIKGGFLTGQKVSKEMSKNIQAIFPEIVSAYGCSEMSFITTAFYEDSDDERRLTSVGQPRPFYEVKIVDETGQIVPINKRGELLARGWGEFLGYWKQPELTSSVLKNGWYSTGDIGTMDEQGFLRIVGRKVDGLRYKRYSEILYPAPLEETVRKHPKILDAQIIGIPNDYTGNDLCLSVILKKGENLTETELKQYCESNLNEWEVPEYFFFMNEFPLTGARNKVSKNKLKEIIEDLMKTPPTEACT